MNKYKWNKVQSETLTDFLKVMEAKNPESLPSNHPGGNRLHLDPDNVKNGLGQLVLTLVRLLHELLERQAIRRIDSGGLTDDEIEEVGLTLLHQSEELERLRKAFGLEKEDLNLDLGPLGKLL